MVKAGDTLTSPATGESFVFRKTAADTDGKLLVVDVYVAPGGGAKAVPLHIHPKHEERIHVRKGTLTLRLGDAEHQAGPGQTVVIPAGVAHTLRNFSQEEVVFTWEVEPAGHWETLLEAMSTLSRDGRLSKQGRANLFMVGVAFHKYKDYLYFAGIPFSVQRVMFAVLSFLGKLRGYCDPEDYHFFPMEAEARFGPTHAAA